jgi:hypothetical protein
MTVDEMLKCWMAAPTHVDIDQRKMVALLRVYLANSPKDSSSKELTGIALGMMWAFGIVQSYGVPDDIDDYIEVSEKED